MLSKLIAFFACLVALLPGPQARSADIVLRQKVTPVKSVITLGDIADIQGASVAAHQRLLLTPLWVAPPVGERRYVTSQQVYDILVNRGFEPAELNIYGAPRVTIGWDYPTEDTQPGDLAVTTAKQGSSAADSMGYRVPVITAGATPSVVANQSQATVSESERQQLASRVRSLLTAHFEQQSGKLDLFEVALELSRRQADLLSLQTSEVVVRGGQSPWSGRQSVSLHFSTEQGPVELPLSVQVYDTTPVLVTKRPIARGQMLTGADVAIESPPRGVHVPTGRPLVYSLEEAIGKEAARSIREGEVVTADMCLAPQMVERNEIVTIVAGGGGIVIRRQAKALTDARHGDVVEVQLLDSRERLVGRVVGPGQLATLGSTRSSRTADGKRQAAMYR